MIRIAHLTQSVSTLGGGISEAVRALSRAQQARGDQPAVFSVADEGTPLTGWPGESPLWLERKRFPGMWRLPDVAARLSAHDAGIAHVHGLWTWLSIGVPAWSAQSGRPYVVSPHGMLDAWALANSGWKKRLAGLAFERRHLQRAACLIALCQSEADSIRAYGLRNRVEVVPNGMDWVEIGEAPERRQGGRRVLLFLGRIHPKKGLVNALRAWNALRREAGTAAQAADWTFAIAGWDQGGHEAELKALCDEMGLRHADVPAAQLADISSAEALPEAPVLFTGPAFGAQKDALLRRASAYILPSFSEGLPMSVLEAWGSGLPVWMTDACNLPEGFAADAAVRISTDPDAMARSLEEMTRASESERAAMGQRGRALVERQFTWPVVAARHAEIHASLPGS